MKNSHNTVISVNRYVKDRGILMPNNQVLVMEPIPVFKKIFTYRNNLDQKFNRNGIVEKDWKYRREWTRNAIASLIIPVGAFVNLAQGSHLKMRASKALCYSITRVDYQEAVVAGISSWDSSFRYRSAQADGVTLNEALLATEDWKQRTSDKLSKYMVYPKYPFSEDTKTCTSGIHFFIHSREALKY